MKNKSIPYFSILLVVCSLISVSCSSNRNLSGKNKPANTTNNQSGLPGSKDFTYLIDNKSVTLKNGMSEVEIAPGSAAKQVTRYLGNDAVGDLNSDGKQDEAFILTQTSGGSGTFYYVAAIQSGKKDFQGSNAVLLGDRIAVKSLAIKDGKLTVLYADRKKDEPMSAKPSVEVSKILQLNDGKLSEVISPASLIGREWIWVKTVMSNDETITPKNTDAFSLKFSENGEIQGKTDCNNFFGKYTLAENKLTFGPFAATRKYCMDAQEPIFMKALGEVGSFFIDKENRLVLLLKMDSGSVVFK